jgi:hypothetical protein
MLNVIMLSVAMLDVVAPSKEGSNERNESFKTMAGI